MNSQKRPLGSWKIFKIWFPLIAYSAIIFCVSSLPSLKPPLQGANVDKFFHLLEYIPFGYLAAGALVGTREFGQRRTIFYIAILLALVYGISDEIHQMFVEGRFASVWDVAADTLGAAIGSWFYLKREKRNLG